LVSTVGRTEVDVVAAVDPGPVVVVLRVADLVPQPIAIRDVANMVAATVSFECLLISLS